MHALVVNGFDQGGAAFGVSDLSNNMDQMVAPPTAASLTRHRQSSGTLSVEVSRYLLMHTIIFETLYRAAFQVFLSQFLPRCHAHCGVDDGDAVRAPCPRFAPQGVRWRGLFWASGSVRDEAVNGVISGMAP